MRIYVSDNKLRGEEQIFSSMGILMLLDWCYGMQAYSRITLYYWYLSVAQQLCTFILCM